MTTPIEKPRKPRKPRLTLKEQRAAELEIIKRGKAEVAGWQSLYACLIKIADDTIAGKTFEDPKPPPGRGKKPG